MGSLISGVGARHAVPLQSPPALEDSRIDAERILDAMQAARDWNELREMNGPNCGSKQVRSLRRYMAPSFGMKKSEELKTQ